MENDAEEPQGLPERWIVLRKTNGHFEMPFGPVIETYPTRLAAIDAARALANKHQGSIFSWFRLDGQIGILPTEIISDFILESEPSA